MAEKVEFDLKVKNNDLDKALDSGVKKAISLEGVLETALGVLGGGLALKGIDSIVGGFNSLINVGKEAINAAAAQEVATNNLNNALARSGNFTKQASQDLLQFAGILQQTTVFEDDAVIANTALLQSLSKLSTEGLKQGISAAADFATVLGIDLETATRLVAKAAEGNVEAFKRYGVEIKKGSTDAESFANTIEALNKQFGGASAAQLNTYSGSLIALGNAYGDLLEPAGDIIVKNPLIIAGFNEIKGILNETNSEVTKGVPAFQQLINEGFFAAAAAAQVLLDALDGITVVMKGLVNTFQIVGGAIGVAIVYPIEQLIDGLIFLGGKIPGIGDSFKGLVNPLSESSKAIQDFTQNGIDGFNSAADTNVFRELSDGVDSFTNKIIDSSSAVAIAQAESIKNSEERKKTEDDTNAAILAARTQLGIDILGLQTQSAIELQTLAAQTALLDLESTTAQDAAKIEAIYAQKTAEADAIYQGELLKNKSIADAAQLSLANDKAFAGLELSLLKANTEKEIAEKTRANAAKKKSDDDYKANLGSTLDQIATLQTSGSKTLGAIGKAAALAQISISGSVAVTKALELGPILGPVAAAAVGASIAAQAAKVAGVAFAGGGFINGEGGATSGPDNTMANLRKGEMVLNSEDQKTLFDAIKGGGLGGGGNIQLIIDGREIAIAVRNQINSGFRLA